MALAGSILALAGSIFLLLASLGLIRMPDVYNRMQAGTKATTLGVILFLAGIAFVRPSWTGKLILIIIFIVFTNPISSHVLARAAHFCRIPIRKDEGEDDPASQ